MTRNRYSGIHPSVYWRIWIEGYRAGAVAHPPAGCYGTEVDAVVAIDALFDAVEAHLVVLGRNAEPDVRRLHEVVLEGLCELRRRDPEVFADHASDVLGLSAPIIAYDAYDAYTAWRRRKDEEEARDG